LLIFTIIIFIYLLYIILGLDGWTSPSGQSLYVFIVMTDDGREYVYALKNFSKDSHTGEFLSTEILQIMNDVDIKKFCAVISDHASNVALAKNKIATQHSHIIPMRCIAHHINLLTTDIIKLELAFNLISECRKIVTFFISSHKSDSLLRENIIKNLVSGSGLKKHVKTHWTTAFDCIDSIVRC
jgi:hypothetical protein